MLKKAYIEITNVCNLSCSFCHGTKREKAFLSPADFRLFAEKLRPYTKYLYLHVLGEPLLHPQLDEILSVCDSLESKVTLTTNGIRTNEQKRVLLSHNSLYKLCFSLHAYEANALRISLDEYLEGILRFAKEKPDGMLLVFKLWNEGGENERNAEILSRLRARFPLYEETRSGYKLDENVYLDFAHRFIWPDPGEREREPRFCMALRDQIAVLCDGTAVPCCLDAEGELRLGNLYTDSVSDLLSCERAQTIKKGFSEGKPVENLCKHCDFAKRKFG